MVEDELSIHKLKAREAVGLITEIVRFSLHDGPGIRTVVFTKGCPLKCRWCSNPETLNPNLDVYFIAERCVECGSCIKACSIEAVVMDKARKIDRRRCTKCARCAEACIHGALRVVGECVTPSTVLLEVMKDYEFYKVSNGGVTVSGGEPLYQPNFTSELLKVCREEGIHTCLDTSGYAEPSVVDRVLKHVDLVLLDIKHMDPVEHERWTEVSNKLILKNAELMVKKCEVRISLPLIPEVNDSEENLKKTAEFAASLGIEFIDILPLHKLGENKYRHLGMEPPYSLFKEVSEEMIVETVKIIESYGLKTTVGREIL